jgi:hypothetical protein
MRLAWAPGAVILAAVVAAGPTAGAQPISVIAGMSAFLTRDRGWNFDNNVAVNVGVERVTAHTGVRVLGTLRYMRRSEGYAAVFPPFPQAARNGVTVGLHGLVRGGPGGLYLLAGPERYQVLWEGGPAPPRGGTWVAAAGLGLRRRTWAIEGRYGAFARSRGTTRGHLDVGLHLVLGGRGA